ncbi:MAG: CCA tRNA nucleotidyltransferase [Planctomycetota bacterium]
MEPEEAALSVVRRLREAGHQSLYAGGCVRDRLLGRAPSDYDVATDAHPEQVRALFRRTLSVGEQFGIVIVRLGGQQVEVATFRAEGEYSDGRRPDQVHYADDAETDAQRRDFTVNGLFFDPLAGTVLDHIGGLPDLVAGRVRAIGCPHERFTEDRLRILRAPRFAAQLGFDIEPETAAAARQQAEEIRTSKVSPERIRVELAKLLRSPGRARGWRWCRELELLPIVLPAAVPDAVRVEHALLDLPPRPFGEDELPVLWAIALHGTVMHGGGAGAGPRQAEEALRALRCSNKEVAGAAALLVALSEARRFGELGLAAQKRLLREVDTDALLTLLRATSLAGDGDLEPLRLLAARRRAFRDEPPPTGSASPPLIGGNDLRAGGIPPGKVYGRILPRIEDAQLEGRVLTREDALALARELAAVESARDSARGS